MNAPRTLENDYWDNEEEGPMYVLVGQVIRYGRDSCNYISSTHDEKVTVKALTPEALVEQAVEAEIKLRKEYDALEDRALLEKGTAKEHAYGSAQSKLYDEPRPPEIEWNGGMFYGYYSSTERDDRLKLGTPTWTRFLTEREERRARIRLDKEEQMRLSAIRSAEDHARKEKALFEKLKAKFEGGEDGNSTSSN